MATPSNGLTLDPLSDLGKDYATLKAIRNLADNATNDLANARKRLSLIAIMALWASRVLSPASEILSRRRSGGRLPLSPGRSSSWCHFLRCR
jgi:hypothetical protein